MAHDAAVALRIGDFIASAPSSWLAAHAALAPWQLTAGSRELIAAQVVRLDRDFRLNGSVAVHRTATVEDGAVIKGPAIVGPNCFVAAGAYLRDGCWLDEGCIIGPGTEVKSSYLFRHVTLAHFNFMGDSLVGADTNIEAGAVVANHRNEWRHPRIVLTCGPRRIETGTTKFGAIIGDQSRIGANAVLAPGTLLPPSSIVPRLALIDQQQAPGSSHP